VRDLGAAKRFFGRLGFEVADAVVIEGEQFLSAHGASGSNQTKESLRLVSCEPLLP
jgi:hypothetical protein